MHVFNLRTAYEQKNGKQTEFDEGNFVGCGELSAKEYLNVKTTLCTLDVTFSMISSLRYISLSNTSTSPTKLRNYLQLLK